MFGNRSKVYVFCFALLFAVILAISGSSAEARQVSPQQLGAIKGVVADRNGAVIQGASVQARNLQTGQNFDATTDSDGNFIVSQLPFGEYDLKVTAQGFSGYQMHVAVGLDSVSAPHGVQLDVSLGVVTVRIQVDVSADTTICIVCGYTYFSVPYLDLPFRNRDAQQLLMLQPGVVEHHGMFSIQGNRPTNKTSTFDGFNDRDPASGQFLASLSIDAVQEFNSDATRSIEVSGSGYAQATGPGLTAKSKTGTNNYHGQVYDFIGRSGMSANKFFTNREGLAPDQTMYDQAGGKLGGPISLPGVFSGKDHLFFFVSYEHTSDNEVSGAQVVGLAQSFLERTAMIQGRLFKRLLSQGRIPIATATSGREFDLNGDGLPDLSELGVRTSRRLGRDLGLAHFDYSVNDRWQLSAIFDGDWSRDLDDSGSGLFTPGSPLDLHHNARIFGVDLTTIMNPSTVNSFQIGGRSWATSATGAGTDARQIMAVNSPFDSGAGSASLPESLAGNAFLLDDNLAYVRGTHSFHAGFQWSNRPETYANSGLANGRIYYSDPLALVSDGAASFGGNPSLSVIRADAATSVTNDSYRPDDIYAFVSDQWRPNGRTVINAGLNYNYYSSAVYDGANGGQSNFAPFLSFATSLTDSELVIVRGGASIVYAPPTFIRYGDLIGTPLYPIDTGFASRSQLVGQPAANWSSLPGTLPLTPTFSPNLSDAYSENFSLGVQYTPARLLAVELDYSGVFSHHLIQGYNLNRADLATYLNTGASSAGRATTATSQGLLVASDGNATYNALQVRATSREGRRLSFQVDYTFSKSIDTTSTDVPNLFNSLILGPVSAGNLAPERGPSDFDRRHRIMGFFTWRISDIDRRRSLYHALRDGWQFSGILTYQSGANVSIYSSGDFFTGRGDFNADGVLNDRPAYIGPGSLASALTTGASPADRYLNAALFGPPGTNGRLALSRNILQGPGYGSIDLALQKSFAITEDHRIQFRLETFDLTNHVNFAPPVTNIADPEFGASTQAGPGRVLRVEVRYSF